MFELRAPKIGLLSGFGVLWLAGFLSLSKSITLVKLGFGKLPKFVENAACLGVLDILPLGSSAGELAKLRNGVDCFSANFVYR